MESVETSILILGAGGAGLCAALHAADASPRLDVALVVKGLLGRAGCTRMVQGGYNAVLGEPDSLDAHFLDTVRGGAWINDQELVWTLVQEAPGRLREFETRYGCFFDRGPDGRIHRKPFAGQAYDRTVHKGDLTGIEIMNRLAEQVAVRPNIRVLEECRAVELLVDDDGRSAGALALDMRRGAFVVLRARATLLATGAGPTMYRVFACSADKASDGLALAGRAGLPLRDMEMVQFHPTGLVVPGSLMTGALLEEGLRGAGGHLRNGLGERYMAHYDPVRLERATRDLVARASFLEIAEGRGAPNGGVWIDVSHLGAAFVERAFPGMVKRCRDFGRDLTREPVEVGPTAHFMMGGVPIDPTCRTALPGLFAAGEDAGGVHGANRLGGNGVAESTVFGGIAGDVMAEWVVGRSRPARADARVTDVVSQVTAPLDRPDGPSVYRLLAELRDVMWDRVGVIRDAAGLRAALDTLAALAGRAEAARVPGSRAYNLAWQDWLDLRNRVLVARLIARSALERRESRGAHYRRDFPAPDPDGLVNVFVRDAPVEQATWTVPVAFSRRRPETATAAEPAQLDESPVTREPHGL